MSDKPMIVRYFQAAKPDVVARTESMHVIALTDPDILEIADEPRFGNREIFGAGDFHIACIPLKNMDAMSSPFGDGRIVGETVGACGGGLSMCGENEIKIKRLRRLHGPQP